MQVKGGRENGQADPGIMVGNAIENTEYMFVMTDGVYVSGNKRTLFVL